MLVSRILSCPIIYLVQPTLRLGRAALNRRFTWLCNLPVRTKTNVATDFGRLLPCLFTLTLSLQQGGYFLLRAP